jgi:carboxyl-terminal processing protease
MSFTDFRTKFSVSEPMMQELVALGSRAGIKANAQELARSKEYIRNQVKALLAKSIFQSSKQGYNNEFYQISYERDSVYQRALQLFAKASDLEAGRLATVNGK